MIVQPYIPAYRRAVFDELSRRLSAHGHELIVASGQPQLEQAGRGDSVSLRSAQERHFRSRTIRISSVALRLAPSPRVWRRADVVIVELAAGSVSSYLAILGRHPVGVWGHVGSYVARDRKLLRSLRRWQVRKADHVLAYTASGAATAIAYGARSDNVTALSNTVDTGKLRHLVVDERRRSVDEVRADLGIDAGPVFAVIGGLDESKRVDLFVATLDTLWAAGSAIHFIVAGRGKLEHLLHPARDRGQLTLVGYADEILKARIARVGVAIFNPGRVGLVAVESFALGLPIVTGEQNQHAPEFEYLRPGEDSLVTASTGSAMARTLTELANDPDQVTKLSRAAEARAEEYPLDLMIDAMEAAVCALLAKRRPDRSAGVADRFTLGQDR